jgi:hypothetical protein
MFNCPTFKSQYASIFFYCFSTKYLTSSFTKMLVDSPEEFASQSYDYVIVGGGTAGLTLAARLTEDPNVSVGGLEAGLNRLADPNVLVPGLDFNAISNPGYDWVFRTAPQVWKMIQSR